MPHLWSDLNATPDTLMKCLKVFVKLQAELQSSSSQSCLADCLIKDLPDTGSYLL